MIQFTNTLTGDKEEFKPIQRNKVKMYHCGPTVYDDAHIGNLRSFIFADTIRRTLEFEGFKVKQIMNVTDIGLLTEGDAGEDKMVKGLKREGLPISLKSMKSLGEKYTRRFINDLEKLNIEKPDKIIPASSEIKAQIKLIKKLDKKGYTYTTSDGLYFDTSKFTEYGKLGGIDLEGLKEGARVQKNTEKRNATDFALWKLNNEFGFDSPWGQGSPGWHIECSAISMKHLSETFDIHTGGIDLIPIHHNNEIAQSTCATDKPLANYWLHSAHVQIPEGKMSKSEGTGITLSTLEEQGIPALAYRYWILTAHYKTAVSFSTEVGLGATNALMRIAEMYLDLLDTKKGKPDETYIDRFKEHIENDLNTPQAIALLHELMKDSQITPEIKKATVDSFDKVLGLDIAETAKTLIPKYIPSEIKNLIQEREEARKGENWDKADKIRKTISEKGFELRDSGSETRIFHRI